MMCGKYGYLSERALEHFLHGVSINCTSAEIKDMMLSSFGAASVDSK
jgi:hypothetical protein